MAALATGTVTFFFSDIEGSTRLLEALGRDYSDLLGRHRRIARDAFSRSDAVEMGTEGDSFFAVFPSAAEAVAAAVAIQRAMAVEEWPQAATPRVRIGLHTSEARIADEDYVGLDVHRAARIMAAAHGGQILISEGTHALVERSLSDGIELRDLGQHRLRDLSARERLFQRSRGSPPSYAVLSPVKAIIAPRFAADLGLLRRRIGRLAGNTRGSSSLSRSGRELGDGLIIGQDERP